MLSVVSTCHIEDVLVETAVHCSSSPPRIPPCVMAVCHSPRARHWPPTASQQSLSFCLLSHPKFAPHNSRKGAASASHPCLSKFRGAPRQRRQRASPE